MDEIIEDSGLNLIIEYLENPTPEGLAEVSAVVDASNESGTAGIIELLGAVLILGGINTVEPFRRSRVYYSALTHQYLVNERRISERQMRRIIAREQDDLASRLRRLAVRFIDGEITLEQFRRRMSQAILDGHLRLLQIGAGGRSQVNREQLETLTNRLIRNDDDTLGKGEFTALADFLAVIGGLSAAQIAARAYQYGLNIRPSYEESRNIALANLGYVSKRFLDPTAEHCAECPAYETLEWTPSDQVVNVGEACSCRGRCRCIKIYARAVDVASLDIANFSDAIIA